MEKYLADRRKVLLGGGALAAATVTLASPAQAQEAADPTTPITDSIGDKFDAMLTPNAAKITEADAVLINEHLMNPSKPLPANLANLTQADIDSLIAAFHAAAKQSYNIASLAPPLTGTAFASSCCCTCTPASCCSAAAQSKPSRSRLIA